jgi:hypothetical protein
VLYYLRIEFWCQFLLCVTCLDAWDFNLYILDILVWEGLWCVWLESEDGWSSSILILHMFGWRRSATEPLPKANICSILKKDRSYKSIGPDESWVLALFFLGIGTNTTKPSSSVPPPSQATAVGSRPCLYSIFARRPPFTTARSTASLLDGHTL